MLTLAAMLQAPESLGCRIDGVQAIPTGTFERRPGADVVGSSTKGPRVVAELEDSDEMFAVRQGVVREVALRQHQKPRRVRHAALAASAMCDIVVRVALEHHGPRPARKADEAHVDAACGRPACARHIFRDHDARASGDARTVSPMSGARSSAAPSSGMPAAIVDYGPRQRRKKSRRTTPK